MCVAYYLYQDALGHWRWYLLSAEQRKIANSSGAYPDKTSCLSALRLVMSTTLNTPIFEDGGVTKPVVPERKRPGRKRVP